VQLLAWGLRARVGVQVAPAPLAPSQDEPAGASRHATHAELEALFEHLERALVRIEFLDPRHPSKLMPRLSRPLAPTRLENGEDAILRGICTRIERHTKISR